MNEFIEIYASSIEIFLNSLELVTLIVSLITFLFVMFNKFSKGISQILKPCGITFTKKIRILFLCRKSPDKKRAFLEYAILKSKGHYQSPEEWDLIINGFKNFYRDNENTHIYEIENCTPLLLTDFTDAAERYFSFFEDDDTRLFFGINESVDSEEPIKWVLQLSMNEAYITPTCLLTGLLSDKEDNWTEFVNRYVSTAYIMDLTETVTDDILSEELYLTFAWLLWGPSLELHYQNFWAGLCQISFGDESNSIPAIANSHLVDPGLNDMAEEILSSLANDDKCYGVLLNTTFSLYENEKFYKKITDTVRPDELYFYEKIQNDGGPIGYSIESVSQHKGYRAERYYCTAYVWILFEIEMQGDDEFHPEKTVAFFEHANLADRAAYEYLIGTLLDKSIKHFGEVFDRKEYAGRKYRFIAALNEEITQYCLKRYREVMEKDERFAQGIILNPRHTCAEVFEGYDNFFSQELSIEYEEVDIDNKNSIIELGNFYTEIFMDAFTDDNERESFDNLIYYLKEAKKYRDGEYRYHILLAKNGDGDIMGGCIFDYFKEINSGVIEFIAVNEKHQSTGIGTSIFRKARRIMNQDALAMTDKPLNYIFCEVDSPAKSKSRVKKYLYFWKKHKYGKLDFNYIQPALSKDKAAVNGLWLTVTNLEQPGEKKIPSKIVKGFLRLYMKYALQIENPEECPEYQAMAHELDQSESTALVEIQVI